jgi:hypothetical protein
MVSGEQLPKYYAIKAYGGIQRCTHYKPQFTWSEGELEGTAAWLC